MGERDAAKVFAVFNEVSIIQQLSKTLLESRMPPGFLVSHFGVLNHLTRVGDGRTPLEIANAFQVPKTTMTHTLGKLEAERMVEVRANPADGRSKQVWITDAGRAFRDSCTTLLAPEIAEVLAGIDAAEFDAALPFLMKLRAFLDQMRD